MRSQHNAWLHAAATVAAIVLALLLHFRVRPFTAGEWCGLAVSIVAVWVAETFNTGLEVLAEAITHERHPTLKIAKDVAAAAVLLASGGAVVVGAILFVPRLGELLGWMPPVR
ncbi:MAG: diacylglycerol kinase family protein [Planctomycetes bacterium]|nr:diacylglycerol kinase family protein [Planctomycetota bacterium]